MARVILDKTKYRVLGNLIVQLRFESPQTLLEQSYKAERLIKLLASDKQYPYDFICYKLTDFKHKDAQNPALLTGRDVIRDLVTFISQISQQLPVPLNQLPENARTIREIADVCNISTKTLQRWLPLGLAQRSVITQDNIRKSIILDSTWQWFIDHHEHLVARAAAFSRLSRNQRQTVIQQARYLYQKEKLSRHQIENHLATKTGRARETIRYILSAYDKNAAPEDRIFPIRVKLTDEIRQQIFDMFVRGLPIEQLARIYGRSRSSIYRLINEVRQERWRTAEIEPILSHEFDLPCADQTILPGAEIAVHVKSGSDNHLATLSASDERNLFRAYNYLKWKQLQARKFYVDNPSSPIPAAVLDKLEELQGKIDEIKGKLILVNQALVISIAKKHLNGALSLDELISEGMSPIMKAVEKFDYTKGFKFSTYASWAVMKHFARVVPLAGEAQHHYMADDELDLIAPGTTDIDENISYQRSLAVTNAVETLDEREQHILNNRFGLDRREEPLSLAQLGKRLGITKERVRQIESKAMTKLHSLLGKFAGEDEYTR
jgi:RNA polymerase sigma factor (sigma-70 family)